MQIGIIGRKKVPDYGSMELSYSDEPIRSLEAAAKVVRRHALGHLDRKAEDLLHRIEAASTAEQAEAAGKAFRDWAQAEGLLLVPPEDEARTG
jgi:hypothetical protein